MIRFKKQALAIFIVLVIALILLYRTIQFSHENNDVLIPILIYHNFDYNITKKLLPTTITPDEFDEQIKYLTSNGYKGITLSQLYNYVQGREKLPPKPFIVTMDDGYYSNYKYSYPILKKYNTPGTIFVATALIGRHVYTPMFTWEQAKEMESSGFIEIQNHSNSHGRQDKLSYDELKKNVMDAQKMIDDNLGKRQVKVFAYPGGRCNEYTRNMLKELGINIQMTGLNGIASRHSDLSNLKRLSVKHNMTGRDIVNKIEIQKTVSTIKKFVNIN